MNFLANPILVSFKNKGTLLPNLSVVIKFRGTVVPQHLLASELATSGTHYILRRKNVSAFGACLPLIPLAGTCMSHVATRKRKCFINRHLFGTCQNELTRSTEVPLYSALLQY